MVGITEISAIVAAAGVLVGVVLAVLELRNLVEQRQTDTLMRLYSTWGEESLQKACLTVVELEFNDYDDYVKKYEASGAVVVDWFRVAWFFNGVGILLQSRLVDIKLVDKLFGYIVIVLWEKLEPIIEGAKKKQIASPRALEWFEFLYNEMKKREQKLQKSKA